MCRAGFALNTLRRVVGDEEKNQIVASGASGPQEEKPPEALKKTEALLKIFEENPNGRFLVFSRYDNPFATLESQIEILGIKVRQLKGNKDAVAATLRSFQAGEIRCLLLNSRYAGSGLNITAASHVILLHAMSLEEDKQILGRAYRLGREDPLYYIRLLHPDEVSTAE
jgi:ATP-dependent RNA helicase RhlE